MLGILVEDFLRKKNQPINVCFITYSEFAKAVLVNRFHFTRYLSGTFSTIILGQDHSLWRDPQWSILGNVAEYEEPTNSEDSQDKSRNKMDSVLDYLINDVRVNAGVNVFPPLPLVTFLRDRFRHDSLFCDVMLPRCHLMIPLMDSNGK